MSMLAGLLSVWWCALVALLLGSALLAALQPWLARGRAGHAERPPVSVLVPLRREEEAQSQANGALGQLDYPAFEILFSVKRDSQRTGLSSQGAGLPPHEAGEGPGEGCGQDMALHSDRSLLPKLNPERRALAGHTPSDPTSSGHLPQLRGEGFRAALVTTAPRPNFNPKLANLIEPIEIAANDLLLIKDTATVLPPNGLTAMVAALMPGVGLVCAVPIARAPHGLLAQIEAALINTYGARLLLALSALGGGAGIGAAMLLRRSDLQRAGGLETIATAVADDHALARLLGGQGLRTVFAAETVDQALGGRRLAQIWRRHLRWAICRRLEEPLAFFAEPLTGLLAACVAGCGVAYVLDLPAARLLAATIVLWPLVETALAALKGWPLAWTTPLAILARELAVPLLWLNALLARRIVWGSASIPIPARRRP
jgi:ceramide glucosyltransferase